MPFFKEYIAYVTWWNDHPFLWWGVALIGLSVFLICKGMSRK